MSIESRTIFIKKLSQELGFNNCGISKAQFLEEEAPRLEQWLKKGMNGKMSYMENHFEKRLDPTKLVEGAKSVISLLLNYYPENEINSSGPKISKYAYGKDYHVVIKERLREMIERMHDEIGDFNARIFVDSAPVLDKAWAAKSGLGWIGKNTNLINKESGSFFFVAEIISDLSFEYDTPAMDHCGTCTKCIDACPTDAITDSYVVDGSKCISYFTIELKDDNIPDVMKGKFKDWAFGCDICQDVCPWNRFSSPNKVEEFSPIPELIAWTEKEWSEMTEEIFNEVFKESPLKRSKFKGLKRNLNFIR